MNLIFHNLSPPPVHDDLALLMSDRKMTSIEWWDYGKPPSVNVSLTMEHQIKY